MSDSTVHVYVFEGFADWEPAFATAGIHQPDFQREPGRWQVKTVGASPSATVRSLGGLTVLPDLALDDLDPEHSRMLILPGGTGWEDRPDRHMPAVALALDFLARGVPVAAICGATAGLARAGALDERAHTSNALAYLKGTAYAGAAHYRDEPAVLDADLITAGGMASLEFAREIFQLLRIYDAEVLEAWYQLNKTGRSEFFARMARASQAATAEPA
ncbi:MAG: glutamine amidotransferase [Rubrivivax sp.]|nr:MAG: glutamine amidotransferase [Rubrivivax sp.]